MLADFTIHIHEARKPLAVRVKVYDNVSALRGAATKYNTNTRNGKDPDPADMVGVCHRIHMANDPVCAIVRLAPPHIGAGIVAHEMAHAAVWLWEIHNKFERKVPLTCANDEWFAWVLGELVRRTTDQLHKKGVYNQRHVRPSRLDIRDSRDSSTRRSLRTLENRKANVV